MKTWYIRILPRPEVLDVQGRTVLQMLKNHDMPFTGVRVGKIIELKADQEIANEKDVLNRALKLGLYNPLVEMAVIE